MTLFVRSTLRDSLLLWVIRWDAAAAALKSWPSWLWRWNSSLLSLFVSTCLFSRFFDFPLFRLSKKPNRDPIFLSCFRQVGKTKQTNNGNCRYWFFEVYFWSKPKIETRLVAQMSHWIFVLVQKDSNVKKESFCCTEPSRLFTKFTTQNRTSKKRKSKFFIATILCFPE